MDRDYVDKVLGKYRDFIPKYDKFIEIVKNTHSRAIRVNRWRATPRYIKDILENTVSL